MTETKTIVPTELKAMARHAVTCRPCMVNVARLFAKPPHLERMELMCTIEWCATRRRGRKAHA
jgi:hypothetical protein